MGTGTGKHPFVLSVAAEAAESKDQRCFDSVTFVTTLSTNGICVDTEASRVEGPPFITTLSHKGLSPYRLRPPPAARGRASFTRSGCP